MSADASAAADGGTGVIDRVRVAVAGLLGKAARGPVLWYALFTIAGFAIALVATFPHELVVNQALRGATGLPLLCVTCNGAVLGT